MVKYRFCYAKYGDAKYVSHLDLIRLFSRVFKRAGVPLTYSEGFNPHPKLAIGLPLSVGVTSECEYMDAELERQLSKADFEALNKSMPIGLHFVSVGERIPTMKKLADISYASYRVTVCCSPLSKEALGAFMKRETVLIEKTTKRKTAETDILPDISSISIDGVTDDGVILSMILAAGPSANLKPDLVLKAMEQYIEDFSVVDYDIHRMAILGSNGRPML